MVDSNALQGCERILCIRLDALGDILMTTPALAALKKTFDCEVTLLTSKGGAAVTPFIPTIDKTIVYDAPWMKSTGARSDSINDYHAIEHIRSLNFDAAVIFTVYSQNPLPAAFFCFLAGIKVRIAHCRENPYQLLTHWIRDEEPGKYVRHEVRRQLDLVASVGAAIAPCNLQFAVPNGARTTISQMLTRAGIEDEEEVLVVHPGASAPSRRYRPAGFVEALAAIWQRRGLRVILTGDEAEVDLVRSLEKALPFPCLNLAGKLGLAELSALLERADVLLANNTGPVHISAAVGTPVVDLYALTNPQHTPWEVPSRVLYHDMDCRFCYQSVCSLGHNGCLQWIEPEEIANAVCDLLTKESVNSSAAELLLAVPNHQRLSGALSMRNLC